MVRGNFIGVYMSMIRNSLIVIAAVIVLFWLLWPKDVSNTPPTAAVPQSSSLDLPIETPKTEAPVEEPADHEEIAPIIFYDTYQSVHGALPPSLAGTTIPFKLSITESGELIVDEHLRTLFDYFLTLDGEEPLEIILERIKELLATHLPEAAKSRAIEVLESYLALKNAELELNQQMRNEFEATGRRPSIGEMKAAIKGVRGASLDPEVYDAFYRVEDQLDEYTISRIKIQGDDSLSQDEKQQALLEIEQLLPQASQAQLQKERSTQQIYQDVETARAEGATDEEIFSMREQAFGTEAAHRYAKADEKKAHWESRIANYRQERQMILETTGVSEQDKEMQINELRERHFSGNELKRIPVIDKMRDAQAGN